MRSGIKTLLALLCVLAISALASQFWLDRPQEAQQADSASCAVYRSFYNQELYKKALFVRPTSRSYNPKHRSFYNEVPGERATDSGPTWRHDNQKPIQTAPMRFQRDTGKFKSVQISPNKEPYKKPIREAFEKDTSGFFEPLLSSKAVSIERCFDEASQQPQFYNGSYEWLSFREELLGLLDRDDRSSATILSFSPVGFSEDGRQALLYVEYYCPIGFCGGGGFHLFEMRSGLWTVIGDNWIWVS